MAVKSDRTKPQTPPALLDALVKVVQAGKPVTAKEVGVSSVYLGRLVDENLVRVVDHEKTGRRGRPARIVRPTDAGRKRGQRAIARANA